eukprot:EG_transcript_6869
MPLHLQAQPTGSARRGVMVFFSELLKQEDTSLAPLDPSRLLEAARPDRVDLPPVGRTDSVSRPTSDCGSGGGSDSALTYTHDPYSFDGRTYLPAGPCSKTASFSLPPLYDEGTPATAACTDTTAPGPYFVDPPLILRCAARRRCGCVSCASPPPTPSCDHPRPWKRLRAKRCFTFYACRECGVKWRGVTPSRASNVDCRSCDLPVAATHPPISF